MQSHIPQTRVQTRMRIHGPLRRLSYKGLGEPLCFMAFGPSATPAFYLALLPPTAAAATAAAASAVNDAGSGALATALSGFSAVPGGVWASSVLVGMTTSIILFTSHFHQIEGDTLAGKMSPLVRLGPVNGYRTLVGAVAGVYVGALACCATGVLPWPVAPALALSAPSAAKFINFATENHLVPARIKPLKKFACMWHIAYGLSLGAGLMIAGQLLPQ